MIKEASIMVIKVKCDKCGKIINCRMYLSINEFEVERKRTHVCKDCSTRTGK